MQYIYTMKGLGKVHPPDTVVLKDIWLSFLPGAKIGVLGLNGAGKSSLLRIMAGEDTEFIGEAYPAEGISVGYLSQEPRLDSSKDVRGNVEEGMGETLALLTRFNEISDRFAEPLRGLVAASPPCPATSPGTGCRSGRTTRPGALSGGDRLPVAYSRSQSLQRHGNPVSHRAYG